MGSAYETKEISDPATAEVTDQAIASGALPFINNSDLIPTPRSFAKYRMLAEIMVNTSFTDGGQWPHTRSAVFRFFASVAKHSRTGLVLVVRSISQAAQAIPFENSPRTRTQVETAAKLYLITKIHHKLTEDWAAQLVQDQLNSASEGHHFAVIDALVSMFGHESSPSRIDWAAFQTKFAQDSANTCESALGYYRYICGKIEGVIQSSKLHVKV